MGMPANYSPSLPRVSEIVEWAYPFTGEARERFEDWLWRKDISYEDYMREASSWGRYVHNALETYAKTGEFKGKKYKDLVGFGIQWWRDSGAKLVEAEKYLSCKDYQGTCDAIVEIDGEKVIIDYKSYSLAKRKFGIETLKYKKPSEKLKKARLQLSLYGRVLNIKKFAVLELTQFGYKYYPLEPLDKKELDKVLKGFENRWVDEE